MGFVALLLRCCGFLRLTVVECVSTWLVGYVSEVGRLLLSIYTCISVRV